MISLAHHPAQPVIRLRFVVTSVLVVAVVLTVFSGGLLMMDRQTLIPSSLPPHLISAIPKAAAVIKIPENSPAEPCLDFFNCRVMDELNRIHNFLYTHKNAAGYTPETRNIQPTQEMVRLLIDTQAHGYLNMYKLTRNKLYLTEAQSRLDAILLMGDSALRHTAFDGMLGYTFLTGYELTKKQAYYTFAFNILNQCKSYQNLVMNWGMMCGMAFSKAYQLTGYPQWLDASRQVIANTKPFQYRDGSFPHIENLRADTGYSMWMTEELMEIRLNDPNDPNLSPMLVRLIDFLKRRVNSDGTINYEDQYGQYYESLDGRGWTDHLASLAAIMRAVGENDKSQKLLERLFALVNPNLPYPDKSAYPSPNNPLANDAQSEIRTSLVFWYLSYLAQMKNQQCASGEIRACTQAGSPTPAEQYCVRGTLTPCAHVDLVEYRLVDACWAPDKVCYDAHCYDSCSTPGYQHCLAGNCSQCITTLPPNCFYQCDYQNYCSEGPGVAPPTGKVVPNSLPE